VRVIEAESVSNSAARSACRWGPESQRCMSSSSCPVCSPRPCSSCRARIMWRRVTLISALLTGPPDAAVDDGTRPRDAGPLATLNTITGSAGVRQLGAAAPPPLPRLGQRGGNEVASNAVSCPGQVNSLPSTLQRRSDRESHTDDRARRPRGTPLRRATRPATRPGRGVAEGRRGRRQLLPT